MFLFYYQVAANYLFQNDYYYNRFLGLYNSRYNCRQRLVVSNDEQFTCGVGLTKRGKLAAQKKVLKD